MVAYAGDTLIEGSIGRTVAVKLTSQYMGDGDTIYSAECTIENEDGTYRSSWCGKGGGWSNYPNIDNCVVDGDVAKYEAHLEALKEQARRERVNREAYDLKTGRLAIVGHGKRKRKYAGKSGFVFWHGHNQYGEAVGIQQDDGERFFVAAYQVHVVPTPEEMMGA